MPIIVDKILQLHHFLFVEMPDPRNRGRFLLESPGTLVLILISYLYFVTNVGPRLMEKRVPLNLRNVLIVYNSIQVICNLFIFVQAFRFGWGGKYNWICAPIDWEPTPDNIYLGRLCHFYFLIKLTDLLDTIFMVLRKRTDHISFLHVYHHTGMCILAWGGSKYLPGGHATFLGFINTLVHGVMYSYYLLSVISPHSISIRCKKFLTQLQMIQFLMVAVHISLLAVQPNCNFPKFVIFVLLPQNLFMFTLFWDFYHKAYCKKQQEKNPSINDTKNE